MLIMNQDGDRIVNASENSVFFMYDCKGGKVCVCVCIDLTTPINEELGVYADDDEGKNAMRQILINGSDGYVKMPKSYALPKLSV